MPKPVQKKQRVKSNRLALRKLATELEQVKSKLHDALVMVDGLWQRLYTTGLDKRGPITEKDDDIPF